MSLGYSNANNMFRTPPTKVKTKEEKKISSIAKRSTSRVRDLKKPSPVTVTTYK
jgi:hypothetical protein